VSDYEVWTYDVEILNDLTGQYMNCQYEYDLGEEGANGINPHDRGHEIEDEIIREIEDWIRIIPRFVRSSHG